MKPTKPVPRRDPGPQPGPFNASPEPPGRGLELAGVALSLIWAALILAYVLMTPPVQTNTLVLWGGPGIMLLLAGAWFVLRTRKTDQAQSVQVLSEADKERVREALSEPEGKA